MKTKLTAGLVSAVALAACAALPTSSQAADLYGRGSMKDTYAPVAAAPAIAGPCYLRGDVGYSLSSDVTAHYVGNGTDPTVRGADLSGGSLYEVGLGCGSGSRGLRGEIALGFRHDRDFKGDVDIVIQQVPVDPPIKTSISTYTVMANAYFDLGNFHGFVPYVGAGVGVAHHDMGYVTIEHPASPNPQHGDTKVDLAWSVMAGFGYQLTTNAILDVGYRYIDLGSANSSQGDTAQYLNPKLVVTDMTAHEFKVGMRYHFGSSGGGYAPFK